MKSTNNIYEIATISPIALRTARYSVMELPYQSGAGTPYQYLSAAVASLLAYEDECESFLVCPVTGAVTGIPLSESAAVIHDKHTVLPMLRVNKLATFARALHVVAVKLHAAGNSAWELFTTPWVSENISAENAEYILELARALGKAWNIRPNRFARPQAV